jgi:hypothetical protein
LWGFFSLFSLGRKPAIARVTDDDEESDFDSYYDGSDGEDERAGMLEMAERGGGVPRGAANIGEDADADADEGSGSDDASDTEKETKRSGVFLVSDPVAGPAPLESPTPKK